MRPHPFVLAALMALAVPAVAAEARAPAELQNRTGIGYARAIGGTSGLSFLFGITNHLAVEGLLGIQYVSFEDEAVDRQFWLDIALGAHYQILQGTSSAFSAGGRLNVFTGPAATTADGQPIDVNQFGVDIPLRVWWWPQESISIHAETGIAFLFGPDEGVIAGGPALQPKGMLINVFDNLDSDIFGSLGLTLWW